MGAVAKGLTREEPRVGHLLHKYTNEYFLGSIDALTGRPYGVLGHEEYTANNVHERHRAVFDFTLSVAGGIENKDILEIGFGRGDHIPLFLKEHVHTYYGIDFSPASFALTQQHIADRRVRLELLEAKDLREHESYDVITMYDVFEHIPVFEMEVVWRKFKKILRTGGSIIISTPIYSTPNTGDHTEEIPSVMGMHCQQQTMGTLLRTCHQHGFIIGQNADRFFGLVRRDDLSILPVERRTRFTENHQACLTQLGLEDSAHDLSEEQNGLLVPPPGRMLIGCVAENTPKYLSQAIRLVQSIRWFGGTIAGANIMVCIVDEADGAWVDELRRWGAFVRIVPRFSYFHPHSNKLRFLELPEIFAYDTVMMMDCDTIVVQDPSPFLRNGRFQAKIADLATVPAEVFHELFAYYGLSLPDQRYRCTLSGEPTIWYCNAGVLVFPRDLISLLYPAWRRFTIDLSEKTNLLKNSVIFCEQASLTLAYHASPIPFQELPVEMNFPIHPTKHSVPKEMYELDPVIIHYHHLINSSGLIEGVSFPLAQERIDAFNERLREYRRKCFNNQLFWDFRYAGHPALGSDVRKSTSLIRKWPKDPLSTGGPLSSPTFIVGCMRSGTTLLAQLLGTHADIVYCPFELKDIWSRVGGVPMASPKTGDKVCPQLGSADARPEVAAHLARAFANEYRRNFSNKNNHAGFLSKNPHLCNKLPFVDAIFMNQARFIWIYRDLPRVVASLRRLFADVHQRHRLWHYWLPKVDAKVRCWNCFGDTDLPQDIDLSRCFPGGDIRFLAEYWLETNRAVSAFFKIIAPARTLTVREEALIANPDKLLAECLAFLDVPLDPTILERHDIDRKRNESWVEHLSVQDRQALLEFVEQWGQDVQEVFPEGNLVQSYESALMI